MEAEADAARKRPGILVAEVPEAGLGPWIGQLGAIHGKRDRLRLDRVARLDTMAASGWITGKFYRGET